MKTDFSSLAVWAQPGPCTTSTDHAWGNSSSHHSALLIAQLRHGHISTWTSRLNKQSIQSSSELTPGGKPCTLSALGKLWGSEPTLTSFSSYHKHFALSKVVLGIVKTRWKTNRGKQGHGQKMRTSQEWGKDEHQEMPGNHCLKLSNSSYEISLNGHTNCMHMLSQLTGK